METKLTEIEVHLAEIKKDLKYHIQRTDALEDMVKPTYKLYIFCLYAIKALIPLSTIVGLYMLFHK